VVGAGVFDSISSSPPQATRRTIKQQLVANNNLFTATPLGRTLARLYVRLTKRT